MMIHGVNSSRYEEMQPLRTSMFFHRFFNRHGGVSAQPFASLNVSFGTGDNANTIRQNRALIKKEMGIERLVSGTQVHGRRVYVDSGAEPGDFEVDRADAFITNIPGTGLMIQQADCQGVLLSDEVHGAIGAVHSGWRGSVANIIGATVEQMAHRYGTDPAELRADISPSLGPCCAEFVNHRTELPDSFQRFQVRENYFDFWRISTDQLMKAGLSRDAIHLPETCTCCSPDYFSYRRAVRQSDGICGRQASVICIKR